MNEVMNEGNVDKVLGETKTGCEEFKLVLATFRSRKKSSYRHLAEDDVTHYIAGNTPPSFSLVFLSSRS